MCDAHTLLSIADFHVHCSAAGTITADIDISQLDGEVPTAVKYASGNTNCCDMPDPTPGRDARTATSRTFWSVL